MEVNNRLQIAVNYIIEILLGTDKYNNDIAFSKHIDKQAKVTIIDSGFFDEGNYLCKQSMPTLPLNEWHGIPLLYGENVEEQNENGIIIYADIIASTFFMVTRYEELLNPEGIDLHGRFSVNCSISSKASLIERPIVDEYGRELRKIMRKAGIPIAEPDREFKVYFTHDVDTPWKKWSLKKAVRTTLSWLYHFKEFHIWPLLQWAGICRINPYDTFEWMIDLEERLKKDLGENCEDIYFIIGTDQADEYTESYIFDTAASKLIELIDRHASEVGLHIGYNTGGNNTVENILAEKHNVESMIKKDIVYNRYHYLRALGMDSFRNLIKAGITDDFTMGYAEHAGFRLGTSQCIRWIDPENMCVTNLKLHPLIIMDGSLSGYMKLGEEEAFKCFQNLFEQVKAHKGEFIVLFHNSAFKVPGCRWMESFYKRVIEYIRNECNISE